MREILTAGGQTAEIIGRPRKLVADFNRKFHGELRERLRLPELGAGALLDIGVYPVAFAYSLFGPPNKISASGTVDELGVDLAAEIRFTYSGPEVAEIEYSMLEDKGVLATIECERGRIEIDGPWFEQSTFRVIDESGKTIEAYAERDFAGRGMQFQALDMERRILAGELDSSLIR
ncbi:MAG: hypothetical protein CGW95_07505, partial [Phenylobacterium zucineum]